MKQGGVVRHLTLCCQSVAWVYISTCMQPKCCKGQGSCAVGKYELSREKVEFSQYMKEEGYHIIPIKPEHQLVCSLIECL